MGTVQNSRSLVRESGVVRWYGGSRLFAERFASAQVSVLREQMADISDLGYYSEHVASEAGRKVLSEVTERYAPYRKKNWGERRESKGLIFKQNPHVS